MTAKTYMLSAYLSEGKQAVTQINRFRNKQGALQHTPKKQNIREDVLETLFHLVAKYERNRRFLDLSKILKLNQDETNTQNRQTTKELIETVIKPSNSKSSSPGRFKTDI